ncbi:MAG: hypothetical protein ACTSR2_01945 [Candidatus Hodarchaeales archaeon]
MEEFLRTQDLLHLRNESIFGSLSGGLEPSLVLPLDFTKKDSYKSIVGGFCEDLSIMESYLVT